MSMVHQNGGMWNILIEKWEIIDERNFYHFLIKIFHIPPFWWTVDIKFSLKVDH